jgi:tetratricopeptide (TPR) repeat protein
MLGPPAVYCGAQEAAVKPAPRSAAAITDMRVNDPVLMDQRSALLSRGEAELARGDVAAATDTFERAAMMLHAPDTEMGLVRAYMQAGQYRRAQAFCAHVAGAHLESAPAGALYAWLLRAGGQGAVADRVLRETIERLPQDPVALDVRRAFASPAPVASGLMLQTPHRMAPQAVLAHADLGAQPLGSMGVTILRLDAALAAEGMPAVAARDPFAGSAGFAFEYAAMENAAPAWPWLTQGFFGAFQGEAGLRKLGIGIAGSTYGGPVLDAAGRLAGMVLQHSGGGEAVMLPASRWADVLPDAVPVPAPSLPRQGVVARPGGAIPADEAYENGLRVALQVIVLR